MRNDEFDISRLRELRICGNTIKRIVEFLNMMERKHKKNTASFIEGYRNGTLDKGSDFKDDYTTWESSYESLKQWQDLERKYQEQLRIMKI